MILAKRVYAESSDRVHAESSLLAGAWRYFQQNGNFNASTDQQNGNVTMYRVHVESSLLAGAWWYFQQNGNFNASTDQQNGIFTMYRVFVASLKVAGEAPSGNRILDD
ncbi:hypothetical protein DM860_015707 [Cuscuta australis]|uniref:Uncharacterized protein n=1 Tax=Cuscuta australis TaxID=267555 RepID=A0A328D435_9ASTE|nr:hypothetical protein DM860_015707 [Cuscuta australis]